MKLVLADIEAEPLEKAVEGLRESGASVIGRLCNVATADSVDRLRDETLSEYGAVHVVCNNAGVGGSASVEPIWERSLKEWDWGATLMPS